MLVVLSRPAAGSHNKFVSEAAQAAHVSWLVHLRQWYLMQGQGIEKHIYLLGQFVAAGDKEVRAVPVEEAYVADSEVQGQIVGYFAPCQRILHIFFHFFSLFFTIRSL